MNRLRQRINTSRQERHQRKQDSLVDYVHNPNAHRSLEDLKTDDVEILGGSKELRHFFRDRYRFTADRLVKRANKLQDKNDMLEGAVRLEGYMNKKGTDLAKQRSKENRQALEKSVKGTREKYATYRKNRIDIKIERLREKVRNSPDSFWSRQINSLRGDKLRRLEHSSKVKAYQVGKLEQKRKQKPEKLRKKIDQLVHRKIDAEYRKAQRKHLKERHGIGRTNFIKRTEFLARMSADDKRKIVREAILLARKKSIKSGRLSMNHEVDNTLSTRKVTDEYGRTIK